VKLIVAATSPGKPWVETRLKTGVEGRTPATSTPTEIATRTRSWRRH
jgi:hypothetical protein